MVFSWKALVMPEQVDSLKCVVPVVALCRFVWLTMLLLRGYLVPVVVPNLDSI
jgi:hypothetical protein